MNARATPEGFMKNAQGHLVPVDQVKPVDKIRDELVQSIIGRVHELQQRMKSLKADLHSEIESFLELSAQEYGASYGGVKGNVTLSSYDGRYQVRRAVAEHLAFDERLQVAKTLIDECIHEWTAGSSTEVQALVEHAFQTDKAGKISTSRVLSLRALAIDHPKWLKAMQAIVDSIQVTGSKSYIRFYERMGSENRHVQVPLDFAAL